MNLEGENGESERANMYWKLTICVSVCERDYYLVGRGLDRDRKELKG
jgi:hypothetical protein